MRILRLLLFNHFNQFPGRREKTVPHKAAKTQRIFFLTTKDTKKHEKSKYRLTTEDAEHTEEIQIHFTMKNMKEMK